MKIKVTILTVICALAMVMPVMAKPYVSGYYPPMGTSIKGQLTTSIDYSGGRPIAKHLNILTATGSKVEMMVVKYDIKGRNGNLANVHENSRTYEIKNTNKFEIKWDSKSNEMGSSYTVFATHEMRKGDYSYAVYTSTEL